MMRPLFGLFLIAFLASSVAAFGVGAEYWTDRQLEMYPGQSTTTFFEIQNGDSTTITVEAEMLEGSEVATLVGGPSYSVGAGEKNRAQLRVDVPSDASIGDRYTVKAVFRQTSPSPGDEGTVQFAFSVAREFDVIVVDESEVNVVAGDQPVDAGSLSYLYWIIGIIILIIIVWLVVKYAKK